MATGGKQLSVVGERYGPHTAFVAAYGLGLLLRQLITFGFRLGDCLVGSRFLIGERFDLSDPVSGRLVRGLFFLLGVCQWPLGDCL